MKRILFVSAMLLTLSIPVQTLDSPLQPIKDIVTGRVFCTAFAVNSDKRYWMTAHHCAIGEDGKPYGSTLGDSGEATKLVAGFADIDVAVLSSDLAGDPYVLAPAGPNVKDEVNVTGFGYGIEPAVPFWGKFSGDRYIKDAGRNYALYDMAVWPGHSGSPVVNARGQVVGVMQVWINGRAGGVTFDDLKRRVEKYFGA